MRYLLGLALFGSAALAHGQGVAVKVGKEALDFTIGKELVARYQIAPTYPKPIFWPIHAPGGPPLTRAWPLDKNAKGGTTDHPHHQSAWFCHGDVIPEGVELKQHVKGVEGVDFWSVNPGHGNIVCTAVGEPKEAKDQVSVRTTNEWRTADGQKVLDEVRVIHLHDLGPAHLLVLDIDLHASVCPITFGDTKEGALGVRVNDAIRAEKTGKGKIENARGKVGEAGCWGRIADWCDYSGPIDGQQVGLTILADPKNPYPTAWHVRGYGLMAANPFGRLKALFPDTLGQRELVRLAQGDHLRLRYGILLHRGDAEAGQVAQHYRRFVALRGQD